jgi:hypothetical protein
MLRRIYHIRIGRESLADASTVQARRCRSWGSLDGVLMSLAGVLVATFATLRREGVF